MKATITDIVNEVELDQVLGFVNKHHGVVVKQQTTNKGFVEAEFSNKADIAGFDIEVCDLGHTINWNN